MIGSKQPTPIYLSPADAAEHCKRGISTWKFASTHNGDSPDVILAGIGVEVTFEVIKAAELLAKLVPALRIRVVNISDLLVLPAESQHPHALTKREFAEIFTLDKPVCFNYHSYAAEIQGLLWGRPGLHRMSIAGYKEEGSTTTPFDMMLVNHVSRFHVASRALRELTDPCHAIGDDINRLLGKIAEQMAHVQEYIKKYGKGLFLCWSP
jgi:xylulose-5-phosphate/fructose-6-phosphate phosphoketolase